MKPRLVMVEWIDSADIGAATWLPLKELGDADVSPASIITAGWLVSKSKSALLLTLSVAEHGDARGVFCIPRVCVKKITRLTPCKS